MLEMLEATGFFDDDLRKGKEKQGKVAIQNSFDGSWTKCRFILKEGYIYYHTTGEHKV